MTLVVWLLRKYAGITSITTIGDLYALPTGMPAPHLPSLELTEGQTFIKLVQDLFPSAFTIAMLGAIESLLSAMVADGVIGDKHNSNTELIAQGVANVVTPFFGGIPATGAIARTMANINNGGRTPVAGMVHALLLLLVLLCFGPLVGMIPMACLAGVLIIVSYNMSGWREIIALSKAPKSDFIVMLVTFVLTVIFDLTIAIEIGLLLAIILFLKRTNEATVIGVETRTSAPVRIVRDRDTLQHVSVRGLFPCGEGAGYAGGIVSAGIDGERCAEMAAEYAKSHHKRA
jgi:SulP family sulfate permease